MCNKFLSSFGYLPTARPPLAINIRVCKVLQACWKQVKTSTCAGANITHLTRRICLSKCQRVRQRTHNVNLCMRIDCHLFHIVPYGFIYVSRLFYFMLLPGIQTKSLVLLLLLLVVHPRIA